VGEDPEGVYHPKGTKEVLSCFCIFMAGLYEFSLYFNASLPSYSPNTGFGFDHITTFGKANNVGTTNSSIDIRGNRGHGFAGGRDNPYYTSRPSVSTTQYDFWFKRCQWDYSYRILVGDFCENLYKFHNEFHALIASSDKSVSNFDISAGGIETLNSSYFSSGSSGANFLEDLLESSDNAGVTPVSRGL
jgi:hypothetical protein